MTFVGRLKQHSSICRRWRGEARTGGVINGVTFAWEVGGVFRTMPLTTQQVKALQGHEGIILETVGTDLAPPATVDAPEKPVAASPVKINNTPLRSNNASTGRR